MSDLVNICTFIWVASRRVSKNFPLGHKGGGAQILCCAPGAFSSRYGPAQLYASENMLTHLDNVSQEVICILVFGFDCFELIAKAKTESLELKVGVLKLKNKVLRNCYYFYIQVCYSTITCKVLLLCNSKLGQHCAVRC